MWFYFLFVFLGLFGVIRILGVGLLYEEGLFLGFGGLKRF